MRGPGSRRLVYVSGAPGSGKTTLAGPLAAELGYALLSKDRIKETLHDVLGPPGLDRERSRRLGAAAMELLWALAADTPAVVLEANFRPYSEYERGRLSALALAPVEVHCECPPEVAVARYNSRVTHPVHVVSALRLADMAEYDRPVGIGRPVPRRGARVARSGTFSRTCCGKTYPNRKSTRSGEADEARVT